MKENIIHTIETPLENLQELIVHRIKDVTKPIIIFSDLDETLTNDYMFIPETNNHFPILSPEIIGLISPHLRIIIATARLADDPVISIIHQQLQIPPIIPIIAEDGGALVFPQNDPPIAFSVPFMQKLPGAEHIPQALNNLHQQLTNNPPNFKNQDIFISKGLTILKVRVQDSNGNGNPNTHLALAEILVNQIPSDLFEVQTTGSSVTIKPKGISKALGLKEAFSWLNHISNKVPWEDGFILGLGDNQNDQSIFSRSDLSISVGSKQFNADILCPHGANASIEVIKAFIRHSR